MGERVALCRSSELLEGGEAVPFDVVYQGQTCRAFALRWEGLPRAYLNRCTHVPMEMDFRPNHFLDITGRWIICATHGAMYSPSSGQCAGGPCRGGLVKIDLDEVDGMIHWHTAHQLKPLEF